MMEPIEEKVYVVKDPFQQHSYRILLCLFVIAACCKILLFPAYKSTDLLVHRHWKSITRHLNLELYYFEDQVVETRHTLDYPPGFIFLEYLFANNPITNYLVNHKLLDDKCLKLLHDRERYQPTMSCVAFMRSTVILSDIVFWLGAWFAAGRTNHPWYTFCFVVFNPAFLWLDHVHFQYNGFLLGILLVSIACLLAGNQTSGSNIRFHIYHLAAAATFALLLTLKHLYLTLGPWYLCYLFRRYCHVQDQYLRSKPSIQRLLLLGTATLIPLLLAFVPFLVWTENPAEQLAQMAARLFPLERGLVHDYWAGNVWALLMAIQKIVPSIVVLPSAGQTAILLAALLLVGAIRAWHAAAKQSNTLLLASLVYSTLASFLVGYHVHEKAVLTTLVPMTVWMVGLDSCTHRLLLWPTSAVGLLGLFPLLFQSTETALKIVTYAAYLTCLYHVLQTQCRLHVRSSHLDEEEESGRELTVEELDFLEVIRPSLSQEFDLGKDMNGANKKWIDFRSILHELRNHLLAAVFVIYELPNKSDDGCLDDGKLNGRLVALFWGLVCATVVIVYEIPIRYFGRYEFLPLALCSVVTACGLLISFAQVSLIMMQRQRKDKDRMKSD